jgi:hypothetical protein
MVVVLEVVASLVVTIHWVSSMAVVVVVRLDTQGMGGILLVGLVTGQVVPIICLPNRVKVVVVEAVPGPHGTARTILVQELVVVVLGYMAKVQMVMLAIWM